VEDQIILTLLPLVLILVFTLLVITWGTLAWQYYRAVSAAHQCPQCSRPWAREDVDRELIGIFKESTPSLMAASGKDWIGGKITVRGKYKVYHRCKYCGHEWTSTKVGKV
jgi:hypothetical protein